MNFNIHIDKKEGPESSSLNDNEYYRYFFKLTNKEGVITQYMVETATSPHHDHKNYSIFEKQQPKGEWLYINPTAQYQIDSLPFTLEQAQKAVETYELRNTLNPDTYKTLEDLINVL